MRGVSSFCSESKITRVNTNKESKYGTVLIAYRRKEKMDPVPLMKKKNYFSKKVWFILFHLGLFWVKETQWLYKGTLFKIKRPYSFCKINYCYHQQSRGFFFLTNRHRRTNKSIFLFHFELFFFILFFLIFFFFFSL